jgi:hypothetical protein
MEKKVNVCRILVVKPDGKRAFGRPRHSWVHNIKIDGDVEWGGMG